MNLRRVSDTNWGLLCLRRRLIEWGNEPYGSALGSKCEGCLRFGSF
ncbi:MAG: hypothetical protein ACTS4U_01665 [Candidatus Hodgkinia cicadicola]